ncbi:sigma-70 family RNA polymerase sigma factor [Streptomyces chartreusis]|uniref:sigma-70 family RNA polymerase sigma factor n=1 Tax=Streptomyces chartreusis TaxID=1969 RepID=UPI0036B1A7AD
MYDEYAPIIFNYVVRLQGGDLHRAEDIVQETLLRYWEKGNPEGELNVRPWLFRVARNLVIDGYRKRMARPQEVDAPEIVEWIDSENEAVDRTLSAIVVDEALKCLSLAHRTVLYETFFLGQTTEEAAAALGIPVGTVKSRMFYALRALRTEIEKSGRSV